MEGQRRPKKGQAPTGPGRVNVQGIRANEASLKARSKQDVNPDRLKLKKLPWEDKED